MPTMRAWRILGLHDLRQVEVAVPVPGPGEVLLRVAAAGLCHSDLLLQTLPALAPGIPAFEPPRTIGHEFAGYVVDAGAGACPTPGDELVVGLINTTCGRCRSCANGRENLCRRGAVSPGVHRDGGLADYVLVGQHGFVPVGPLDPAVAAPLADAGAVAMRAARLAGNAFTAGGTALVIGVGGLGHIAIQVLRAAGLRVIAVDRDEAKVALAGELGADAGFTIPGHPDQDLAQMVRDQTEDSAGVDAAFDFVGAAESLGLAGATVRAAGTVVLVGTGSGHVPFGYMHPVGREVSWLRASGATRIDLMDVTRLVIDGRVRVITQVFDFHQADVALAALEDGRVKGRAVVAVAP
jgi:alcohol dehydrogenase, propanol-preferring